MQLDFILIILALLSILSAARQTDDGQAVLFSELLSQPFRIALLRNTSLITEKELKNVAGHDDVAVALMTSPQFPSILTSEVYTHPLNEARKNQKRNMRLEVAIGKYSNAELLKAQKAPKEEQKSQGHVRKSKLGQLYDTSFTATVYEDATVLLALSTLNPYLSSTATALGGRTGTTSQAVRFEATGHSETEGLMTADKTWWESILSSAGNNAKEVTKKQKLVAADGKVYGTFSLIFINRQEFVLHLRDLDAPTIAVSFYGFATPPVSASTATLASSLATYFGIGSGNFIETLFDLPQGSVEGANPSLLSTGESQFNYWIVLILQTILTPFKWLIGDINTDAGEDSARALVQSVATVASWVTTSWPLLLAAVAVFLIKIMADILNDRKEQKKMVIDLQERKRAAKEAEAKVAELLGKAGTFNKQNNSKKNK